jgi:hypothetical protein
VNFWEVFIQPNKLIDSHGIEGNAQRNLDDEPRRAFFLKKKKEEKSW